MLNDHCHRVSTHLQSINIIIITLLLNSVAVKALNDITQFSLKEMVQRQTCNFTRLDFAHSFWHSLRVILRIDITWGCKYGKYPSNIFLPKNIFGYCFKDGQIKKICFLKDYLDIVNTRGKNVIPAFYGTQSRSMVDFGRPPLNVISQVTPMNLR